VVVALVVALGALGALAWRLGHPAAPSTTGIDAMMAVQPRSEVATVQAPPTPAVMSTQEIFQMASGGVTLIEVFDNEGNKRGQGSGFVVSPDGMTLTNYHVIRGAARATAKFSDGTWSEVDGVASYDAAHDVAVIKLASPPKTVLRLGNSDNVKVGQKVVAIGSPLGFQNTLSEGIVSGVRNGVIQMSDPISPGSSGGAVFDSYGRVIGISVATVTMGQNLNFAVPINWAKPYLSAANLRTLADVAAENTVTQDVLNGSVTVPNGKGRDWNIVLNPNVMSNAEIDGQISSSGGMDGKITLALYFQNHPIYACRNTSCVIHQRIVLPGAYALMLDNRVSPIFGRTVTGQISLKYVK
jgi:Trypsin-like peptidase domain